MFWLRTFKIIFSIFILVGFFSKFHSIIDSNQDRACIDVNFFGTSSPESTSEKQDVHVHICHFGHNGCIFSLPTGYLLDFSRDSLSALGEQPSSFYTAPEQEIIERPPIT